MTALTATKKLSIHRLSSHSFPFDRDLSKYSPRDPLRPFLFYPVTFQYLTSVFRYIGIPNTSSFLDDARISVSQSNAYSPFISMEYLILRRMDSSSSSTSSRSLHHSDQVRSARRTDPASKEENDRSAYQRNFQKRLNRQEKDKIKKPPLLMNLVSSRRQGFFI